MAVKQTNKCARNCLKIQACQRITRIASVHHPNCKLALPHTWYLIHNSQISVWQPNMCSSNNENPSPHPLQYKSPNCSFQLTIFIVNSDLSAPQLNAHLRLGGGRDLWPLWICHHKHIQVQRSFSRLVSLNVPFIYFVLWTSKTRTASGHLSELASQAAMSKECIWFIRWNDFQMQGEVLAYLFFHYTLLAAITLSQNSLLFSSWHLVFLSCHIYEIFPIYWNREGIWSKQHPTVSGPVSVILSKILSGNRKQINVLQTWNTFVFSKLCFQNTLILSRE